jgi:hypothetical protein
VKEPLINLYITKRFRVKGDKRLWIYKLKMAVEGRSRQEKLSP